MKCPYCGAEVGLEETVCSYCGRPNEQALRHQQDMADYRLRYRETEAAVSRKTKHYSQLVPRVMVLLVLIIGCVITGVISESAYSMPDQSRHRAAMRNAEKTRAVLNTYLDQGDYISFSSYMDYNGIRVYSDFPEFREISYLAYDYKAFVLSLEKAILHGDEEEWKKYNATSDIRRICDDLDEFYNTAEHAVQNAELDQTMMHAEAMQENIEGMLSFYLGIDKEKIKEFLQYSDAKKASLIEEVLLNA